MRVTYHDGAKEDIRNAVRYLGEQGSHLVPRFLADLDATIDWIRDRPSSFAIEHEDVRRWSMRGFSYDVLFVPEDEEILVIAVRHHARDDDWKDRV